MSFSNKKKKHLEFYLIQILKRTDQERENHSLHKNQLFFQFQNQPFCNSNSIYSFIRKEIEIRIN